MTRTTTFNTRPVPTSLRGGPHLVPLVVTYTVPWPGPPTTTSYEPGTLLGVGMVAPNDFSVLIAVVGGTVTEWTETVANAAVSTIQTVILGPPGVAATRVVAVTVPACENSRPGTIYVTPAVRFTYATLGAGPGTVVGGARGGAPVRHVPGPFSVWWTKPPQ